MAKFATSWKPDFVMSCGDNFYPSGVRNVQMEEEEGGGSGAGGTNAVQEGVSGAMPPPPPPLPPQGVSPKKSRGGGKKKLPLSFAAGACFSAFEFKYWEMRFLKNHPSLRVPWKVVLGNHDYNGMWEAQVAFTNSKLNPGGLWQMRGDDASVAPSRVYAFCRNLVSQPDIALAAGEGERRPICHFVGFDASACQFAVRRVVPDILSKFQDDCGWLDKECKRVGQPLWRIVYQHHPFYTSSKGHLSESRCLRQATYHLHSRSEDERPGLDLEKTFFRLDVDAVFAGHEHVFQMHESNNEGGKRLLHLGCGATVESHLYQGPAAVCEVSWLERGSMGFVAAEIVTTTVESVLRVMFVRTDGSISKTLEVKKTLVGEKSPVDIKGPPFY